MPRTLIPGYIDTDRHDLWDQMARRVDLGVGDVVIINPASGPGTSTDDEWRARIVDIHACGAKAFGYVALNRGLSHPDPARPTAWNAALAMARWPVLYPIDGYFLDEMPVEAGHPQIAALILLGRRLTSPSGDSMDAQRVIVNPGARPSPALIEEMPMVACWVVHEDVAGPVVPLSAWDRMPGMRQGWLSYGDPDPAGTVAAAHAMGYGWAYATADAGVRGNPWNENPAD